MDESTRNYYRSIVNNSNSKINNLNSQKRKYQNLKTRITNEVLPKLRSGKNSINEAKTNLKNNYSSTEATKKINNLQTYANKVNSIINSLNQTILPAINRKISSINQEIANKQRAKQNAINRLNQE